MKILFLMTRCAFFMVMGRLLPLKLVTRRGGNYFCPSCDVHLRFTDDIAHCYRQKVRSLGEKQHKVLQGTFGRINSIRKKTLPFEKLNVIQLETELRSRNVNLTNLKSTRKILFQKKKYYGVLSGCQFFY